MFFLEEEITHKYELALEAKRDSNGNVDYVNDGPGRYRPDVLPDWMSIIANDELLDVENWQFISLTPSQMDRPVAQKRSTKSRLLSPDGSNIAGVAYYSQAVAK